MQCACATTCRIGLFHQQRLALGGITCMMWTLPPIFGAAWSEDSEYDAICQLMDGAEPTVGCIGSTFGRIPPSSV